MSFYYDGEISEDDHESAECAATEVMAHFPDYEFKVEIIRCDEPNPVPEEPGIVVFRRKEKSQKLDTRSRDLNENAEFYTTDRLKTLLSIITALQGEISEYLRNVKIGWGDEEVRIYFYYDGEISEDDRKSAEKVAANVFANFPERQAKLEISRLDYPARIPSIGGETVYARKEAKPSWA